MNLEKNSKIQLSLSSIMFFAPIIKKHIKEEDISVEDKKFIEWYIKIWTLNLLLLWILILSWIISLFWFWETINKIYEISTISLSILISIEIILILSNANIKILSTNR